MDSEGSVGARELVFAKQAHHRYSDQFIRVAQRLTGSPREVIHGSGWTPLHVQSQEGEDTGALEVMEALLERGADPNLADEEGNTPMTFAREREEPEKVRLLRAHGAKE
jgi:cytohesin